MEDESSSTTSSEFPETQPVPEEALENRPKRSKKWYFIGGGVFLFLALAAFLGARLLKPQLSNDQLGGGQMLFKSGGPGGSKTIRINTIPAKEIPPEKASQVGLFVRREDQSIFIGTGRVQMMVKPGKDGSGAPSSSYDGPVVEVVTTHATQIFQDTTDMNPGNFDSKNSGDITLQQIVKPGSLDDLGANSMVSVWGDKQGDRYVARVVVFR